MCNKGHILRGKQKRRPVGDSVYSRPLPSGWMSYYLLVPPFPLYLDTLSERTSAGDLRHYWLEHQRHKQRWNLGPSTSGDEPTVHPFQRHRVTLNRVVSQHLSEGGNLSSSSSTFFSRLDPPSPSGPTSVLLDLHSLHPSTRYNDLMTPS